MTIQGPITAVLFDLDGVIRHYDPDHSRDVESRHGLPHGSLTQAAFEPSLLRLVTTGRISRAEWTKRIGTATGSTDAAREWLAASGTIDTPVMAEICRIRRDGLRVAVLTNGTDTTNDELVQLGIRDSFDAVFNSATIGIAKPDPRALEHACTELGAIPSQMLFVDDSLTNVAAATEMGMAAIHRVDTVSLRTSLAQALVAPPRQEETP